MRYTLTRDLERLGFIATPFSFYHPQLCILVEYAPKRTDPQKPWQVQVDGITLTKRNGLWAGKIPAAARGPRRYSSALLAAQAGLRRAGVPKDRKRPYVPRKIVETTA